VKEAENEAVAEEEKAVAEEEAVAEEAKRRWRRRRRKRNTLSAILHTMSITVCNPDLYIYIYISRTFQPFLEAFAK